MEGKKLSYPGLVDSQIPKKNGRNHEQKYWRVNLDSIEQWIFREERKAIQKIPISQLGGSDKMTWPFTKSGENIVK